MNSIYNRVQRWIPIDPNNPPPWWVVPIALLAFTGLLVLVISPEIAIFIGGVCAFMLIGITLAAYMEYVKQQRREKAGAGKKKE